MMNMGHGSHVLSLISLIIFCLISFYFTHILIGKSSFNADAYFTNREVYYTGFTGGEENVHQNQVLNSIVEKIRVLLGLKSSSSRRSRNGHYYPYISPSPSPAPAPSPLARNHHRAHPPLHQHHPVAVPHRIQQKHNDAKARRVLTAVLSSAGVVFVLGAIGLFFFWRKLKKRSRRTKRNVTIYRTEAGSKGVSKFVTSQASAKKVSSAPGPDLFYLNSIQSALEPDKCCLNMDYEPGKTYFNQSALEVDEREESNEKLIMSKCSSGRYSSVGEITTVHEITETIKCEIDSGERANSEQVHTFDDKIIPEEVHSSDDESFHSFCDSHSSQRRPSSGSLGSFTENLEITEDMPMEPHCAPAEISHSSASHPQTTPSPPPPTTPPPPPPPPPRHAQASPPLPRTSPRIKTPRSLDFPSTLPSTSSGGIPLPPLPPSIPNGDANTPGVPPPPSQTPHIPLGKDGTPLAKLKPLHWDKVRAAPNSSTVWDKLRSSSFEFDEDMIESLFGYNLQNQMKNDEGKNKTPSPSKHVLEPKRLQNFTILSKALNVTAEQVCGALIRGDGLTLQDLEALSKMVPTKEEEAKLLNYKGDILELVYAERLVKLMLKIPFAFARIEAMLYRESFDDEVHHLGKSFSMLEEACKELRSSRLFLKLLEAVLKTGNRMNVGTIRGEAKAFKLDALLKLADVKGTDGKTTLLHFVVQEIVRSEGIRVSESIMGKINQKSKTTNPQDKEENYRKMGLDLVIGLSSELCNVKKTATVDLDVIASSVANLSGSLHKLQQLVQYEMSTEERKGSFVITMRSFLNYAETKLKELQEDENRVLLHVREITEYFHGHVSRDESNPLRIFVIVRDFLSMLDNVCKELKSSRAPRSGNPLAPFQ